MSTPESTSDILVIHQNRIIFSSGYGPLTKHSKTAASVTQVINLFSEKIVDGEQIHFIRFENHRMIFLTSQLNQNDSLVGIVLIPLEKSAKQVIPAMGIILKLLEEFLAGNILDAQNKHLDCFYQILAAPYDSVFLIPRTPSGILGALVILTAFAHDLQFGIEQLTSNIHFVDPNNQTELRENVLKSERMKILSFTPLPSIEENDNILVLGQKSPLRQYFSAEPSEEVYDVIARLFGDQSNAAKMRNFISNADAYEIAQSIALLPRREDVFIRNEILLNTVLQPGKDIVVTMSTQLMQKLRELSISTPKRKEDLIPDLSGLTVESHPSKAAEVQLSSIPKVKPEIVISAEPDSIPIIPDRLYPEPKIKTEAEVKPTTIRPIPSQKVSTEVLARLDNARKSGLAYNFDGLPIILDTAPYAISITESQVLDYDGKNIEIRIFQGVDNHFAIHVCIPEDRLSAFKDTLEDLSVRIGGEIQLQHNHILIEGLIDKIQIALRALLWLSIVEYLTQTQLKRYDLSPRFKIPRDGSILIIPPYRDYVKEKIPSKFTKFIEEADMRKALEQEALWTLAKTQDTILSTILEPLKKGEGVVFVTSDSNKEMEEIALFLLLISEICGIGFSRW
ncbi:hypothetical protein [Candidatus Hodarchaeum mangrovi]